MSFSLDLLQKNDEAERFEFVGPEEESVEEALYQQIEIEVKYEGYIDKARKEANVLINEADKAIAYHDTVLPYFDKIRRATDSLELIVDNEMWTLPKYRELLFIR